MNGDMAIVNLDRGLPAKNRQTPGDLGAVAQGNHHHLTAHLPQNLRSVSTLQWLQAENYLFRRGDVVDAAYQVAQGFDTGGTSTPVHSTVPDRNTEQETINLCNTLQRAPASAHAAAHLTQFISGEIKWVH
ncbi:MAG: hypothetical protein HY936_08070 [Nitrosomonadales bacterium]|nr:hypothetical protein [Nitrosomonadales bacterium]